MFKLMPSPAYWWPVTIGQPAEDKPGEIVATTFDVQFLRKTVSEQQAWMEQVRTEVRTDAEYVRPLVVGFRRVFGEADAEVPFSDEALKQLLDVPGVGTAIARAYFESNDKAAQKN